MFDFIGEGLSCDLTAFMKAMHAPYYVLIHICVMVGAFRVKSLRSLWDLENAGDCKHTQIACNTRLRMKPACRLIICCD